MAARHWLLWGLRPLVVGLGMGLGLGLGWALGVAFASPALSPVTRGPLAIAVVVPGPDEALPVPPTDRALRFATYNIRHGRGTDDRVDLDRVAATLAALDADVVVLNEVDLFWWRSGFQNQVEVLAGKLGYPYALFAQALAGPLPLGPVRPRYGNALLSRLPVRSFEVLPLPHGPFTEPRALFHAVLEAGQDPDRPLHLFGTHLGLSAADRLQQAAAIREALDRLEPGTPVLLMGDFNEPLDGPSLGPLREILVSGADALGLPPSGTPTFPAPQPTVQIDNLFLSADLSDLLQHMEAVPSEASDHFPLLIELAWSRRATEAAEVYGLRGPGETSSEEGGGSGEGDGRGPPHG